MNTACLKQLGYICVPYVASEGRIFVTNSKCIVSRLNKIGAMEF